MEAKANPDPKPAPALDTSDLDKMLGAEAAALKADGIHVPSAASITGGQAPAASNYGVSPEKSREHAEACTLLVGVTFNMVLAPLRGDHWKLKDEQAAEAGKAYGLLLDKYADRMDIGPELGAAIATFGLFGLPIGTEVAMARAARNQAAAAETPPEPEDQDADTDEAPPPGSSDHARKAK